MYKWQKLDAIFWEVTNVSTNKKAIVNPADYTMSGLFFRIYMRTK